MMNKIKTGLERPVFLICKLNEKSFKILYIPEKL